MKAQFITPVITAFDKDLNIDIEANKNIWDFVIEGGVDGIISLVVLVSFRHKYGTKERINPSCF